MPEVVLILLGLVLGCGLVLSWMGGSLVIGLPFFLVFLVFGVWALFIDSKDL